MIFTREFFDPILVHVAAMSLCAALAMAWTVREPFRTRPLRGDEEVHFIGAMVGCGLIAFLLTGQAGGALVAVALGTLSTATVKICFDRLSMAGAIGMGAMPVLLLAGGPWTYLLLSENGAASWMLTMTVIGMVVSVLGFGFAFAERLARNAVFTHERWQRPHAALSSVRGAQPKVSIHVPCYAEPPEIVIATLDRLARLDYNNFEVLICDNNTADEALWRPVQRHCDWLNRTHDRFRFFHVASLPGAKAGALNFLLDRMAGDTDLVAVIDADYLSEPQFLARLAGYFDDPRIGYVQTPHDYRVADDSPFMAACYREYMPNNKVDLPGINEYAAAFTIGTMCLIRADALEAAGRWAEWCLTEDSEVSVRLRAIGCEGIYVRDTFGRGLIPDTFDDYKKQRFRWTAGPVQQLRRHWRLYLPGSLAAPSAMSGWSKMLEFQRGIAPVLATVGTVFAFAGAVLFMALAAGGAAPVVDIPAGAWMAMTLGVASGLVGRWHRYRLAGCTTIVDMLQGELARLSLTYVQLLAGVAGLSKQPLAWRRTPKFGASKSGLGALATVLPETMIGVGALALLAIPIALSDRIGGDVVFLMILGGLSFSANFLAAPVMALLSERRLERHDGIADSVGATPLTASVE